MKQRIAASILAMIMVASQAVPAMAANDEANHWASAAMQTWQNYGVLKGDENGNLNPDQPITRAELAVMLDRVMEYQIQSKNNFSDLDNSWYTEAILGANAAGILLGYNDGTVQPQKNISRQEAAVLFARVLDLDTAGAPAASYSDTSSIADWALPSVNAMSAEGYLSGSNGKFRPTDTITRAEVITILNNIFASYIHTSGTYTEDVNGTAVISADGVTMKDMTITGDLIIAEGVGQGHVELDSVTVEGRLIVRGGGSNSIVIKGDSKIGTVSVARQGGKVRVAVEGNAKVGMVQVDDGSDSVKIDGKVDAVSVSGADAAVEITGTVGTVTVDESAANAALTVSGTISAVNVAGDDVKVNTTSTAKIDKITTSAADTTVSGSGKVTQVEAAEGSTGATVSTSGTKVENNGSGNVTTGNGSTVKPGESGTSSGNTSGGGSSSGGGSTVVTTATVSNLDELNAALSNSKIETITIDGTIGSKESAESYVVVNVDRAVTIKGGSVYGTFVVTADGVVFDGVTVTTKGDAKIDGSTPNTAFRNAINASSKDLTVRNCTFEMGIAAGTEGISNALSIWPTASDVAYTITGNSFKGFQSSADGYTSTAISISGGISKPQVIEGHETSIAATMTGEQDLAIITGNTFANCKVDYVRDDWSGGQKISSWAISSGNNLYGLNSMSGASYYINGNITRENVQINEGNTLIILPNATLTVTGALNNSGAFCGTDATSRYNEPNRSYFWGGSSWVLEATGMAASKSGEDFTTIDTSFVLDLDNEIPAEVSGNTFTQDQVTALGGEGNYKSLTLYVKLDSALPAFDRIEQKYVTSEGELATMKAKTNTKTWTYDAEHHMLNGETGRYGTKDDTAYLKLALYSFYRSSSDAAWELISDDAAKQVLEFYNGDTLVATFTANSPLNGYTVEDSAAAADDITLSYGAGSIQATSSLPTEGAYGLISDFTPDASNFSLTLKATEAGSKKVRIMVTDVKRNGETASDIMVIAQDTDSNYWNILTSGWGPAEGFPLPSNATTQCYIVAKTAGTYTATVNVVDCDNDYAVLASLPITISVTAGEIV